MNQHFKVNYVLLADTTSPETLHELIEGGEIIEGTAHDGCYRTYDTGASDLIKDAGLQDSFGEISCEEDEMPTVYMTVRYPLTMLKEIEALIDAVDIDDCDFDVPNQAA